MGRLSVNLDLSKEGKVAVHLIDIDGVQPKQDQQESAQLQDPTSAAATVAAGGLNQHDQQEKVNFTASNAPSAVLRVSEKGAQSPPVNEDASMSSPEDSHKDGTHCEVTAAAASTAVSPTKNALPVLRFMHRDHPSLYPGQVQIDEGAWELQQTLSTITDAWYLYGVVHEHTDGNTTLLLDLPSRRLFKRQVSGPVMIVGNLVCTGQDTYAVEKATFPVLFSSNLSSSLLESPMQALEDLVMPHTSSDGSCTPANLAELCTAIKPDTSDMDKDCFKVLMNPEDPTFSDGVHPSFQVVALRVREASELEEALFAAQGPHDVKTPEGLVELSQHLKSSWKLKSLVSKIQERLCEGFAGLCKFLQSLAPGLRFTMQQLRGVLLYTRLWCAAGAHASAQTHSNSSQLNAKDILRAWNVVPLRVIGDGEQDSQTRVSDAGVGDQHTYAQFHVTSVKVSSHKKTRVIRASDTALFSTSKSPAQTRRTKRPAAAHSTQFEDTEFQSSLKRTQYEGLEQHLIGHAARERASGASSHVSRLRTPAQTRRSALFASLRNSAFATVWDPVSGQQVRGKVTAVEYKPGLKIEPVWESLPFETQQLVNSPAAKSPVTPDLPSASTVLNGTGADDRPGIYGAQDTTTNHGHKHVEAPTLLQTSRRFANMRVGEHTHAGATGRIMANSLRMTAAPQKAQSSTPASSSPVAKPLDNVASTSTALAPRQRPHVPQAPENLNTVSAAVDASPEMSVPFSTEAPATLPAPSVKEEHKQSIFPDVHDNPDSNSNDVPFTSAAHGLNSTRRDGPMAPRLDSNGGQFIVHDASIFYGNGTAAGKLCPKSKPKQDPQQTRPVAPFIAGGHTISRQPVGNIYDGRYNRSRLLKPSPATIKNHVLHMDEYGNAAWFPVTHDQAYSRFPAYVEPMTAAEVCTQALIESHGPDGNKNSDAGISVKGDMHSSQAGGWTSASTAAYLYDQMN